MRRSASRWSTSPTCMTTTRSSVFSRNRAVEATMVSDFRILPKQIGTSFAKYFGVPYEPFNPGHVHIESLQGPLKCHLSTNRAGSRLRKRPKGCWWCAWIRRPCAARGWFRRSFRAFGGYVYRVTTKIEFDQALCQLDKDGDGASIDECGPTSVRRSMKKAWTFLRSASSSRQAIFVSAEWQK